MNAQEIPTPLVFILDNLNKAITPIGSFLSNIGNALEDEIIEADWEPKVGEIVLFKNEKGMFVTGAYQGRWQDVRKIDWGKERLATDTSFEPSPYPFDPSVLAKVNHAERNDNGEWVIDFTFSFSAIENILPFDASNTEYALLSNQAHAKRVEMDLAS